MKSTGRVLALVSALALSLAPAGLSQTNDTQFFQEGYLTAEAQQHLTDEVLFRNAVQTYLWALPALNMYGMKEGSERVFGKGFFVAVRLYGPTETFFNQSWKPGDIEPVR